MGEHATDEVGQHLTRRKFLALSAASAGAIGFAGLADSSAASASSAASTLRVGWTTPPDVMNPFTFTTTASNEILWLIYDTLMEYNLQLNPEPSLAATQTRSADGTSFTYQLRSGVSWHDGTPFSASDVKYTFDIMAKHNLGQAAWSLADFKSVTVVN